MVGICSLAQDILGNGTKIFGAACTPGTGMNVSLGSGRIYTLASIDATAWSSLPVDSNQILMQGLTFTGATLATPAPISAGQSINYLIECQLQISDTNDATLQYWNATNPQQPFSGANNSGTAQPTVRAAQLVYQVVAGNAATTGTQVTPTPDSGWTALYVVSVPYGATSISSGYIATYVGAPLFTTGGAQTGSTLFTVGTGYSSAVTTTAQYTLNGDVVALRIPTVTGTGVGGNFSASISNPLLQPSSSAAQYGTAGMMEDNSVLLGPQSVAVSKGSGTTTSFIFYKGGQVAGWTAGNTRSIGDSVTGITLVYKLN